MSTKIRPLQLGVVVLTNSESSLASLMVNKVFDVFMGVPKRDWSKELLDRTNQGKLAEIEEGKKIDASRIPNTKPTLPISS